jgi:hypothetical protein
MVYDFDFQKLLINLNWKLIIYKFVIKFSLLNSNRKSNYVSTTSFLLYFHLFKGNEFTLVQTSGNTVYL